MNANDLKRLEEIESTLSNGNLAVPDARWIISQLKAAQDELTTAKALLASHETGDAMLLEMLPGYSTIAEGINGLKSDILNWASETETLRDKLEAAQNQWQNIATAPRVLGKRFLVAKDCGEGTGKSVSIAYRLDKDEWYYSDGNSSQSLEEYGYRITHWQPLPQPPKI